MAQPGSAWARPPPSYTLAEYWDGETWALRSTPTRRDQRAAGCRRWPARRPQPARRWGPTGPVPEATGPSPSGTERLPGGSEPNNSTDRTRPRSRDLRPHCWACRPAAAEASRPPALAHHGPAPCRAADPRRKRSGPGTPPPPSRSASKPLSFQETTRQLRWRRPRRWAIDRLRRTLVVRTKGSPHDWIIRLPHPRSGTSLQSSRRKGGAGSGSKLNSSLPCCSAWPTESSSLTTGQGLARFLAPPTSSKPAGRTWTPVCGRHAHRTGG